MNIYAILFISLLSIGIANAIVVCTDAPGAGLSGHLNGGSITITNNGKYGQNVGLASYKVFTLDKYGNDVIDDQQLFDSDTGYVAPGNNITLSVDLPDCRYQINSFCGPVLTSLNGQRYDNRKIDWANPTGTLCSHDVPEFSVIAGTIAIIGAIASIITIRRKH